MEIYLLNNLKRENDYRRTKPYERANDRHINFGTIKLFLKF